MVKIIDWMKKGKQNAVKIKVSDFNNTADSEDVTVVSDDLVTEVTHTIDEYTDPAARNIEEAGNLNMVQPSDNGDVINWMHENPINNWDEELSEHDILQKISQEFCVNKEFLNKLGSEIASNLVNELSRPRPLVDVNITEHSNQINAFINLITPQLEKELKRFMAEVKHEQK